jgi:nucleotide-binding universal stress UspA family protein
MERDASTTMDPAGVPSILAPVRADRNTAWAVDFLIKLHRRGPIRVHLLSVQPPVTGFVHVKMFFDPAEISAFYREQAERAFEPMRRALDAAGVPYDTHVVVGYDAEEIAKFAQRHQCRQIVMGPAKGLGLSELVLGSLTHQIEHLMRMSGRTCEVL